MHVIETPVDEERDGYVYQMQRLPPASVGRVKVTIDSQGSVVEHGEHHEPTLKEFFLERAIHVASMERALRWITVTAMAGIAVSAIFIGLRDASLGTVPLTTNAGVQTTIPAVTFWLVVALFSAAWAYVLVGLLHAHRLVRVLALAGFTYGFWELWNEPYPLGTWRMAPSFALLALVWVTGLRALYEPEAERGDARRLRLRLLPLVFVVVFGLELAFWWRTRPYHDPRFFSLAFFHQLEYTSFALIPVLLVAGVDFAEWGDAAAQRVVSIARRPRSRWALPLLALAASGGVLAYCFHYSDAEALGTSAGLGIGFIAAVAALALAARSHAAHIPYAAIFACSVAMMGMILGLTYAASNGGQHSAVYNHHEPDYSLEYPSDWVPQPLGASSTGISIVIFFLPDDQKNRLFVIHVPKADLTVVPDPRSVFFAGPVEQTSKDGSWQKFRSRWKGLAAVEWQRDDKDGRWILAGVAKPKSFPALESKFDEVKDSWKPAVTDGNKAPSEGKYTTVDRAIEGATLGWLGLAALSVVVLLVTRRRGRAGWLTAGALLVFATGMHWTLVQLPTFAYTLFGAATRSSWPQLTLAGLMVAAGGVTVIAVAIPWAHRFLGPLVSLVLGLYAIHWLDRAITGSISAGRLSIAAAVLVLVALLWDIVMSGEAITNRHNRHFPRHSRVMVYLGYLLAVAAAVAFFSSLHTAAGSAEPLFESENFSETGLLFLGISLVSTLAALRAVRIHRDGREGG